MSEDAPATKEKKPMDAATALLRRVNWAPGRYSDNIGIQFLLELKRLGERDGGDGKQTINEFIDRISNNVDMYRVPFNELEMEALINTGRQFHIGQQLKDSTFASNARSSLISRRTLIGGMGGTLVGTVVGQLLGGFNPANNAELAKAKTAGDSAMGRLKDIRARDDKLAPLYDRPASELSDVDTQRILDLAREKRKLNKDLDGVNADIEKATSIYRAIAAPLTGAAPIAGPIIGAGFGIYRASAGEVTQQASKKFEAAVTAMDALINYRLGRSGHERYTEGASR